jgi:hypothetical protein
MELAFDYAIENGLTTEWTTPYTSYNGADGECTLTENTPLRAGGITGYEITVTRHGERVNKHIGDLCGHGNGSRIQKDYSSYCLLLYVLFYPLSPH